MPSEEEADNLTPGMKKVKTGGGDTSQERSKGERNDGNFEERQKSSHMDKVMGIGMDVSMDGEDMDLEDDVSDDDEDFEDDGEGPWFTMGMPKEEKIEAQRPWKLSLIIKLMGRRIDYQFLPRHLKTLWKPQH